MKPLLEHELKSLKINCVQPNVWVMATKGEIVMENETSATRDDRKLSWLVRQNQFCSSTEISKHVE